MQQNPRHPAGRVVLTAFVLLASCVSTTQARWAAPASAPRDAPALALEESHDLLDAWTFAPAVFDALLSRDSTEVIAYLHNGDAVAHTGVVIRAPSSPHPDLHFLVDSVFVASVEPGLWAPVRFLVKSDSIPAGLYRIPLEIEADAGSAADTLELSTVAFLPDTVVTVGDSDVVTFGLQAADGDYQITEVFADVGLPPPGECLLEFIPLRGLTIQYQPCEPFDGLHPPAQCASRIFGPLPPIPWDRDGETNWVKKLTAGVASALGMAEYEAKELLGASILKFLKDKGWKWVLKRTLTRALGWWMMAFAICVGIANAIAVDPPIGDFFFVGEEQTPPQPTEVTVQELVEIQIVEISGSCPDQIHLAGTRTFHRVTDQNVYVYSEPFDIVQDLSVIVTPTLNQTSYSPGDSLYATATVTMLGQPEFCHNIKVQLFAWAEADTGTAFGMSLWDDGRYPDTVADDGFYAGLKVLTSEDIAVDGPYQVRVTAAKNTPTEVPPVPLHGCFEMAFVGQTSAVSEPDATSSWAALTSHPQPAPGWADIRYRIPEDARMRLEIFDAAGRLVTVLADGLRPAGAHVVHWNGQRSDGDPAPSGLYLIRLTAGEQVATRKLIVVR